MTLTDSQLLDQYLEEGSEPAFAELVDRHIDLVHSAALRQVQGDNFLAREIAQTVFCDLARKARSLQRRASLAGWLYLSTRFAVAKAIRGEQRRRQREDKAFVMQQLDALPSVETAWDEIRPVLDDAMHVLDEKDREAILLRYFERVDLKSLGQKLELSEDAARKKVDRALQKLRWILEKRGIKSTDAALAAALSGGSVIAAPLGLGAAITKAALAGSALGAGSLFLSFMTATQMKWMGGLALGAVAVVGIANHNEHAKILEENVRLRAQVGVPVGDVSAGANTQAPDSELARLRADHAELLRLRSEIGLLRKGASNAIAKVPATSPRVPSGGPPDESVPGIQKFSSDAKVKLQSGQMLVTGQWDTGKGTRLMVFVSPSLVDAAGNNYISGAGPAKQVVIRSKFVEVPKAILDNASLELPAFDDLSKYFEAMEGAKVIATPSVLTFGGRMAQVMLGDRIPMPDGTTVDLGPKLNIVPEIGDDGITLSIHADYVQMSPGK